MNRRYDHVPPPDGVSRKRYERACAARREAETLLEAKSRELFETNQKLQQQAEALAEAVEDRTKEVIVAATARAQAEQASAAKSHFLASMSHEIRTPLHGLLGMITALDATQLSAEQRELLVTMKEAGGLLNWVVNDILDLSKIEAGQLELVSSPFYLPQVLKSLQQHYGLSASAKGLMLLYDAGELTGEWLYGDEQRLRQVVGNLLSNAIKFTEAGTVHLSADLQKERSGQWRLDLKVEDTGLGLTEEAKAKLFKPFSQADPTIAHKFGGSGLGLTISRRICKMMDGELILDGVSGVGTVAQAQMRFQPGAPPDERARCTDLAVAEALLESEPRVILVADDSRLNRKVVTQYLKSFKINLIEASDGEQAVTLWRETDPDLILMDINMPVMGGIAAAMAIREEAREQGLPRVPIVALTANALSHQVQDYLEAGLDAHVSKPVSRDDLVRLIGTLLSD